MRLEFLARSCSHADHLIRHNRLCTLRFEKGASLTGLTSYHWFADEYRRARSLDDDGIGIARALLRSYTEQYVVGIHEFSFCRFHLPSQSQDAQPQENYDACQKQALKNPPSFQDRKSAPRAKTL